MTVGATDTRVSAVVPHLYRGMPGTAGAAVRSAGSTMSEGTLFGHFSKFNVWYPVFEQTRSYVERIAPGAFRKTIAADRAHMRVQFDHGQDPYIGGKPLGPIDVLREDSIGAYYEVPLLDTDYNREFILPLLEGRLMNGRKVGTTNLVGASFRFAVVDDNWAKGRKSSYNPHALEERTVTEIAMREFGPVVWPASVTATAGARSLTDHFARRAATPPSVAATAPAQPGMSVAQARAMLAVAGLYEPFTRHRAQDAAAPPKRIGRSPAQVRAMFVGGRSVGAVTIIADASPGDMSLSGFPGGAARFDPPNDTGDDPRTT